MFRPDMRQLAQAHEADLRRAVQDARALQTAPANSSPFYAPALARLGEVLVEVGSGLQERYGRLLEDSPSPEATSQTA